MTLSVDDLIETLYRGLSGDVGLLDGVMAPDWSDDSSGQASGRDEIESLVAAINHAFSRFTIVVRTIVDGRGEDGNGMVAVRGEMRGVHAGEWLGVPATGRAVRIRIHEFHEIADGLVVRSWGLEDWFGWLRQVGAVSGDGPGSYEGKQGVS
ncbi:SnoaL-like polyketide cyclase [Nocardia amikacinitolerans]|uniref:ester cyclase n=1 Tax=Nocardia amikacinitolerans TaxID=756689 RepID=UPI0009FECA89|nr:ester cyclase [Nocardia amikacinitolerans]MCP2317993.1 SnoaL-like polyketide cyclase [Nocardia amikacinitolerans]